MIGICSVCREEVELHYFRQCVACIKKRKTAWYQANRSRQKETQRNWVKNNLEKKREIHRKWVADHPDKVAEYEERRRRKQGSKKRVLIEGPWPSSTPEYHTKWRKEHPEAERAKHAKYRVNNIKKIRAYFQNNKDQHYKKAHIRRSRQNNSGGSFTVGEIKELYKRQNGLCANRLCRLKIGTVKGKRNYHIDHVTPVALGGSSFIENIQLLCASCNRRKAARPADQWAVETGVLFV